MKGLDVSKYQGVLDFSDVKNNFDFVIIKATEGNSYVDTKFQTNQKGFRSTDICLGYYHFARPDLGNTAAAEADWFLKTLGTLRDGEMLCLDYEATWKGDVVSWCYDFLNRIFAKTGVRPLIYLNQSAVKKYIWNKVFNEGFGLWLAVYDYDENKPCPKTPWPSVTIKQYSNKLPYASLQVDGNVFYGSTDNFKAFGAKLNNSDPIMTDNETKILAFVREKSITEGQVRTGYGYITDNIEKTVTDLKTQVSDLSEKVDNLTQQLALVQKQDDTWQKDLTTANASLLNANNSNIILKKQIADLTKPNENKMTAWQHIKLGIQMLTVKK